MIKTLPIVFALRHIETREIMPEMKNGRGYSFWSPSGAPATADRLQQSTGVFRLFLSEKAAKSCRGQWARGIVGRHYGHDSGGPYVDTTVNPRGRSTKDLEIVSFQLVEIAK